MGRTDEIRKKKKKIEKRPADLIILTVKTTVYLPFLTESQALVLSMTFTHLFATMEPNSIFGYVSVLMFRYENSMSHPTSSFMVQNK